MSDEKETREGSNALLDVSEQRLVGVAPDGSRVNNVTPDNQHEVNEREPWLFIMVWDEDLKNPFMPCYIPRTRKMPDIVVIGGIPCEAWDTTKNPPQYRKCMVAHAITTQEKDEHDGKTNTSPDHRRIRNLEGFRPELRGDGE